MRIDHIPFITLEGKTMYKKILALLLCARATVVQRLFWGDKLR